MPLTIWNCVLSCKRKNYFSENLLVLQRNYFQNRIPGSNFLLPTFLTGGKWDFPVANLLLATVNFDSCRSAYRVMLDEVSSLETFCSILYLLFHPSVRYARSVLHGNHTQISSQGSKLTEASSKFAT